MNEVARVFQPKESVKRLLAAAGVVVPDREAYWLGFRMERFVVYTRQHGELFDLPSAIGSYLAFVQGLVPAPTDWQFDQIKQAVQLFARAVEGWRWVPATAPSSENGPEKSYRGMDITLSR